MKRIEGVKGIIPIEIKRRAYDGAILVWRGSPSAERAMQWEIIAVHRGR